jgi:hypothetical protein
VAEQTGTAAGRLDFVSGEGGSRNQLDQSGYFSPRWAGLHGTESGKPST